MKTALKILLYAFLMFSIGMKAQNTTSEIKIHKVWITMVDGSKVKGNLYTADTSGIRIMDNKLVDIINLTTINAEDIKVIKIRRKGKVGNTILSGALVGAGTSVLIGAITSSDDFFTPAETMVGVGVLLVPLGAGIGALAGTKKEKFKIGGDKNIYESWLPEVQKYCMVQELIQNQKE